MMRHIQSFLSLLLICALLTTQFSTAANARFISPDDWDPTMQGVGTNRYAYAGNDPVNKSDPNGHFVVPAIGFIAAVLGALFGGTTPANAPGHNDTPESISDGRQIANMAMGAAAGAKIGNVVKESIEAYGKKKDKERDAKAASSAEQAGKEAVPDPAAEALAETKNSVKFDEKQLQKKFKHADDFGVDGNANKNTLQEFKEAMTAHINKADTVVKNGTYHGDPVTHFTDPTTGLNVMTQPDGTFISGWTLSPAQLANVIERGSL